tara:strand:- start:887 stop:1315 length:429 start_codon:yes stop_codon:yes gene_type:complete
MNEKPAYDPSSLQLIYSVLLMAQLVITVVVIYVAQDQSNVRFEWGYWNHVLIPAVAGVLGSLGKTIWNKGILRISQIEEIEEKLKVLTQIHILQWVIVELATILLLTYTLMESNFFYFIFALVNIIYFFTLRPKIFSFTGGI